MELLKHSIISNVSLYIGIFLLIINASSCQYGAFDINKPNSSTLTVTLDGEDITTSIKDGVFTINLDEIQNGYLIFTAMHYKDNKAKDYPFYWECKTLKYSAIQNGEHSIGFNIKADAVLGFHTFVAKSSVDSSYNKIINLHIISQATKVYIKYSMDETSKIDGIDYSTYESGIIKEDSDVLFVANAKYTINAITPDNTEIQNCTFDIDCPLTSYGVPFVRIVPLDDTSSGIRIIETESEQTPEDTLITLTISVPITNATIKINIKTKRLVYAYIDEIEDTTESTSYISLNKDDGIKQYNITIQGSTSYDTTIFGTLPYASTKGSDLPPLYPSPTDDTINWSQNQKFSAYYQNDETNIPYFTLDFDGINHIITITPLRNTITQLGENIHFYFYVKDSANTIIGMWKIMVGGAVEKIELDVYSVNSKANTSGIINATLFPSYAESTVLWYISETPYNLIKVSTTSEKYKKIAPLPSENIFTRSLMSMIEENKTNIGTIDDNNKYWTVCFENYPIEQTLRKTVYFDTLSSEPLMLDGVSTLLYTLGNASGKFYLIALATNSDYQIFKSIPITISSNGGITIQSQSGVSPYVFEKDKKLYYDTYINENHEQNTLPNRIIQAYPDTAENNLYGVNTRTFYFPHNKESILNIQMQLPDADTFEWQTSLEANKLFTVTENKNSPSLVLAITPLWLTYQKRALQDTSIVLPPQNKNDDNNASILAYGSFNDFIGIGYINYNVNSIAGLIRIIIYDANLYKENSDDY